LFMAKGQGGGWFKINVDHCERYKEFGSTS
jgi:hypothetical protein